MSTCWACESKTDEMTCTQCKNLIDATKEYVKLNTSLNKCPICRGSTTSVFLKDHGLCAKCYRKKGGKPNAPPSPTGREILNYINTAIDIYEKVTQPKRFILQDITRMYFDIMGTMQPMTKKLHELNLAIDEYLVNAIRDELKPIDSHNQT